MINRYQHFDDIAALEGVQPNVFYRPSMGHIVEATRDFQTRHDISGLLLSHPSLRKNHGHRKTVRVAPGILFNSPVFCLFPACNLISSVPCIFGVLSACVWKIGRPSTLLNTRGKAWSTSDQPSNLRNFSWIFRQQCLKLNPWASGRDDFRGRHLTITRNTQSIDLDRKPRVLLCSYQPLTFQLPIGDGKLAGDFNNFGFGDLSDRDCCEVGGNKSMGSTLGLFPSFPLIQNCNRHTTYTAGPGMNQLTKRIPSLVVWFIVCVFPYFAQYHFDKACWGWFWYSMIRMNHETNHVKILLWIDVLPHHYLAWWSLWSW
jgi:hypothetical protein